MQSGMSAIISGSDSETPFGVLIVHCKEKRPYKAEDVSFLQTIANILSIAIGRKEFEQQIQAFNVELEQRVLIRTEQLENTNKQKSRILAMVSHDFKNPLSAIKRFVEMLERQADRLEPGQVELIGYIGESTEQLRKLVTDILDRARIEAGQVKPVKEEVVVSSLVHKVLLPLQPMAQEKKIQIDTIISPDVNTVYADPVLLRQVLVNLISNAIKYNYPEGKVNIHIFLEFPESQMAFQIQDTGRGIPKGKLDMLFTDFYRVSSGLGGVEGTGLGLASAKKLIELQGGTIEVESQEGIGSTFTARLPI